MRPPNEATLATSTPPMSPRPRAGAHPVIPPPPQGGTIDSAWRAPPTVSFPRKWEPPFGRAAPKRSASGSQGRGAFTTILNSHSVIPAKAGTPVSIPPPRNSDPRFRGDDPAVIQWSHCPPQSPQTRHHRACPGGPFSRRHGLPGWPEGRQEGRAGWSWAPPPNLPLIGGGVYWGSQNPQPKHEPSHHLTPSTALLLPFSRGEWEGIFCVPQ